MSEHEWQLVQLGRALSQVARPYGCDDVLPDEVQASLWQLGVPCSEGTSRPPDATLVAASSTATTRDGGRCGTPTSSTGWPGSRECCRESGGVSHATFAARGCPAKRWWRPLSGCSRRHLPASAMRSTRNRTDRSA